MTAKTKDAVSRSDSVLVGVLAVVIATASAAVGSAMTYHPSTDKVVRQQRVAAAPAVKRVPAKLAPDAVLTRLLAEHRCLSEVLYYEARGEGRTGQQAIAEVVFHRMAHGNFGHSICAVVYEGAGHPGCQFSFTCNGELARARVPRDWREAELLAAQILTGEVRLGDQTEGAINFHAVSVNPDWAGSLKKTTQIGNHIFYRGPVRTRDS